MGVLEIALISLGACGLVFLLLLAGACLHFWLTYKAEDDWKLLTGDIRSVQRETEIPTS